LLFDNNGEVIAEVESLKCKLLQDNKKVNNDNINELLYKYEWVAQPVLKRNIQNILPSPLEIHTEINCSIDNLIKKHNRPYYYEIVEPAFNNLSTAYIVTALEKAGFPFEKGYTFKLDELISHLKVPEKYRLPFERFIKILEEDKLLKREDDIFTVSQPCSNKSPDIIFREILKHAPGHNAELSMLSRCGSNLYNIIWGDEDPLSLIFSKSSLAIEQFYKDSPPASFN